MKIHCVLLLLLAGCGSKQEGASPSDAQSKEQEQLIALREEFGQLLPGGGLYEFRLRAHWNETLKGKFRRTIAADAAVATGQRLPPYSPSLLEHSPWDGEPRVPAVSPEETQAWRRLHLLVWMDLTWGGTELTRLLSARADHLPPEDLDLAIFIAVRDVLLEFDHTSEKPRIEEWRPLAHAKNPLYRLLALFASIDATEGGVEVSAENHEHNEKMAPVRLARYQAFLGDTDPAIVSEAIDHIGYIGTRSALDVLSVFRTAHQDHPELLHAADAAFTRCESTVRSCER